MAYRDANTLREHFKRSHYVCNEAECKENLYIVFNSPEELEYHHNKTHRGAPAAGKKRYDAGALLGIRIDADSDEDDHGHQTQTSGRGRGRGRGGAVASADPKQNKGPKDNLGLDFQELFKKGGDNSQIELLPSYVSDKDGELDRRYFLIASRNFNNNVKDGGEADNRGTEQYVAKFTVDDFEAPSQRQMTVDQLFKYFDRYFGADKSNRLYSSFQKYKEKKISPPSLLEEFKKTFGPVKGYKFCWALSLAGIPQANELAHCLRYELSNYEFRYPECVLAKHGKSYHAVFKYLAKKLGSYLLQCRAEVKGFPEEQLNKLISNIYDREIGLLISGKYMQHYISAKSLEVLINVFFTDKDNYPDMFDDCTKEDLVTVYIYWVVIKLKTSGQVHSTPGFRGLEWLREIDGPEAVAFIKVSSPEQIMKKEVKRENKKYQKEDFPTLTDVKGDANQKDLLQFLKNSRTQKGNTTALKYNKKAKPNKVVEIGFEPVKFTQPKYWDSDEERIPVKKPTPAPVAAVSQVKNAEPSKKQEKVPPMEEDWPTLGGNPAQKFVMKPDPTPIKPAPSKKPRIVEVTPQILNEEEFPTFDDKKAEAIPTIFDQMKQIGKPANPSNNNNKGKPKITNVKQKVNTQAMNIANFNNQQKHKEVKEEFPGLAGPPKGLLSDIPEVTGFDEPVQDKHEEWMQAVEEKPVKKTVAKQDNKKKKVDDDEEFPQFDAGDKGDFPPPSMATSFGKQSAQDRLNQNLKGFLKDAKTTKEPEHTAGTKGKVFHLRDLQNVKGEELKLTQTKKDFDEVNGFDDEPVKQTKATNQKGSSDTNSKVPDKNKQAQAVFEQNIKTLEKLTSGRAEGGDFPTLGGDFPKMSAAETNTKTKDLRTTLIIENSDLTIVKKKSKKK